MSQDLFFLSEKIKKLRDDLGLTQAELARKLGLTRSGVNAWEMGLSIPSTQYIIELARHFNVSADYLLNLNSVNSKNNMEKDLLGIFRSMTIEQQRIYIEQGRAFVSSNNNYKEKERSS